MDLAHYTAEPFMLDRTRGYLQPEFGNGKPVGLWLSDDADHGWKAWCQEEEWGLDRLVHRTSFRVAEGANVLHLATLSDLQAFSDEYRRTDIVALSRHYVMWERVVEEYDGVLITPYQWQARLDFDSMWYFSWDVASGCFWNLDAVEVVDA